jgi:hypothetical protein
MTVSAEFGSGFLPDPRFLSRLFLLVTLLVWVRLAPTSPHQLHDQPPGGQDRPVLVHRLIAVDTVEERMLALQEKKRELAAAAVEGRGGAAAGITRADLLALLA